MTSWITITFTVCTTGVLLLLDAAAVPELKTTCKIPSTREYCYSLFGTDNRDPDAQLLDWASASQLCAEADKDLAVVDSPDVQQIVADLVQSIDSDQNQVWIAGRRRYQQSDWAFLNDTTFEGDVTEYYTSSCVKLYYDKHGLFEYREIRCTDDWNVYALCQYNSTEQECQGFYRSGLCYVTSANNINWFDGMTYCYNRSRGTGSLAYDGLDKNETKQWLASVRDDQYSKELLVGIRRQPWIWVLGSRDLPMVYSHWLPTAGDYMGDRCVTIVPDQDQRWKDVPCLEEWYYFVCQNGSRPETTTTTTTTTTTSSVLSIPSNITTLPSNIGQSFTTPRPGPINTGPSDVNRDQQQAASTSQPSAITDHYDRKLKTEHIVAIVVGILVVAAIILSVLAIQRCPRKTDDPEAANVSELKLASNVQATEPEVIFKDGHKQQNGIVTHAEAAKDKDVKEESPTAPNETKRDEGQQREDARSSSSREGTGGRSEEERSSSSADSQSTAAIEDAGSTGGRLPADGEGGSEENRVEDKPKDSADAEVAESAKDDARDDDVNRNELDESLEDTAIWVAL